MAELAGLILAGFPLVISALEHFQDGFEPLQEWWQFEREFSNFIEEIGTQRLRFDSNLEKLLAPFVKSNTELHGLLDVGNPDGWQDESLRNEIRARLGTSYDWYCAICRKMVATLQDLQRRLGIEDGQVNYLHITKWDHELRRIKISFSKKKFKHVKLLSKYNDQLKELLSTGDELAVGRRLRRKGPILSFLSSLQQHSQHLYSVLFAKWNCNSSSQHDVKLLLKRLDIRDDFNNTSLHLYLEACAVRKRIEVRVEKNDGLATVPVPASAYNSGPSQTKLLQLREQVHERSTASATSSLSSKISTRMRQVTVFGTNSSNGISKPQKDSTKPNPSSRPKKNVRMTIPTPVTCQIQPGASLSPMREIKNICVEAASWGHKTGRLGYVQSETHSRLVFYADQSCQILVEDCGMVTLEDTFPASSNTSATNQGMTRKDRFIIANVIASTILQFQSTHWLPQSLKKRDITFFIASSSTKPIYSHPYINRPPAAGESTSSSTPTVHCKRTLFDLGVLLLELTFNKRFETLSLRRNYLGPDGSPNEFTDYCTAKAWHKHVVEDCGDVLADVIERCIDFNFGIPKADWKDETFIEAYIANVLEPLKEMLKPWEGSSVGA